MCASNQAQRISADREAGVACGGKGWTTKCARLTTGEIFQAVAKWRRGRELGVYFVEKDDFLAWPAHGAGPSAA